MRVIGCLLIYDNQLLQSIIEIDSDEIPSILDIHVESLLESKS